eukprot:m.26780 g.26780  ORF g.26780 m.26780 type:complete len:81 (+) comp8335_c0_seq1:259-501(+)
MQLALRRLLPHAVVLSLTTFTRLDQYLRVNCGETFSPWQTYLVLQNSNDASKLSLRQRAGQACWTLEDKVFASVSKSERD